MHVLIAYLGEGAFSDYVTVPAREVKDPQRPDVDGRPYRCDGNIDRPDLPDFDASSIEPYALMDRG